MTDGSRQEPPDLGGLPPPQWPPEPPAVLAEPGSSYLPNTNWTYGHFALALLVGVLGGAFVAAVAISIVDGPDAVDDTSTFVFLTAQALSSLGIILFLSLSKGTGSWRQDYGFSLQPRFLWGIALGMGLQIAVALLTYPLIQAFAPDEGPQQEIAQVAASLSGVRILLFALFVAIVAPIFEEVVFRGMLLSRLMKSMGRHGAVAISGAAFAATHLFDPNAILVVPGLFLVGLALGYAALHAGNLSLPIYMHVGVNGLAVLLLSFSDELEEIAETVESFVTLLI